MNKFDKYYLKQGKLELSILDEEDDENVEKITIHHEDKETREPRIKLTEDIYNTLQTMGKFLTKRVDDEEYTYTQEDIEVLGKSENILPRWNKVIKGEVIKSTQAKQLEEVVRAMYIKAAEEAEELGININKPVAIVDEILQEQEGTLEGARKSAVRVKGSVIFEDDEMSDRELNQNSIDQILLEHFGNEEPQFEYVKRLKCHIDKKIALIENYQ